jgi:hypothetical protein
MASAPTRERAPRPAPDRESAPPAAALGPLPVRDLPEPPPLRKLIGPSVVLVGVGIASGEYVLFPFIASQTGLVFLWAAVVGVLTQFFINMEVERYTLATGETAITGFQRLWKPLGLVMVACAILPNVWPGWATSAATIATFVFGGNATTIAVVALLVIGVILTASPVVYRTVEKLEFIKVAAVLVFLAIAVVAAISADTWRSLDEPVQGFGTFPDSLEVAVLIGAFAYAGAGGTNNLVVSNWIRDKGFGMGAFAPRVVSPITGKEEAAAEGAARFEPTDENLGRWRRWWRAANLEQFVSFFLIGTVTICLFSMLAFETVFAREGLGEADSGNFDFIEIEGGVLKDTVGPWFGTMFWLIGTVGLFGAALGILDYVSRLVADVLKVGYLERSSRWTESRLYFACAWGMIAVGVAILLAGLDQPLVLVVIAASLSGVVMFVYSGLLIWINRRFLPGPIKIRGFRLAALIWAFGFFGVFSVILVKTEFAELL